jgi:hypothetical protein
MTRVVTFIFGLGEPVWRSRDTGTVRGGVQHPVGRPPAHAALDQALVEVDEAC